MSSTTERKRPREEKEKVHGNFKKRKEAAAPDTAMESEASPKKSKHSKKHRIESDDKADVADDKVSKKTSKSRKDKENKDDKKASRKHSKKHHSHDVTQLVKEESPAEQRKHSFPFFTQTISLWVPLYPVGFNRPLSSAADQHLAGLVNHYSPLLGGYLLAYRNVNLSQTPVRANPQDPPTDETPATLASVDEYAVGFGWMTVDVDLFVPSRGAWLEGDVILQNEGAIGVSCFEKFNASIEASRLPRGWKYMELEPTFDQEGAGDKTGNHAADGENNYENANGAEQEQGGDEEYFDAPEMLPTGHWVNEEGEPVAGKLLFRIKNFDVGLAGDNGYLAIEGTMLPAEEEHRLAQQERERNRKSHMRGKTRRLPEFSITQFGKEDEEEDSAPKVEVYKGSRPGTPND